MSTTGQGKVNISEVDGLEIFSLVDNSVDFLSAIEKKEAQSFRQWTKKLHGQEWIRTHSQLPIAEHGFSILIRVSRGGKSVSVLFDTGVSADGVVENAKRMGLDLSEVGYVVLSHGHYDHFGGLVSALQVINRAKLPLVVHEDMFKKRGPAKSDGKNIAYPEFPSREKLGSAQLIFTKKPKLFSDSMILVTGEIPRETSFETEQPDSLILDDRALVFNVKKLGLVIITGCAHAGIINTIHYAQKVTRVPTVYTVMGGFHLAGKDNEPKIEQTVKELGQINPQRIIPSHCTGWNGMFAIATALPEAFVSNSVGNRYVF